jgi:hypothetical protein
LRDRVHPDAVAIYDWVRLQHDEDPFVGARSGVDHWLDHRAVDHAFRGFIQTIAAGAGKPMHSPNNDLTIAATHDPDIRALARLAMRARTRSSAREVL